MAKVKRDKVSQCSWIFDDPQSFLDECSVEQ